MSSQKEPEGRDPANVRKSQSRLKMTLYLGMVLLVSWVLYLVVLKTRVSDAMQEVSSGDDVDGSGDAEQDDLDASHSYSDMLQIQDIPTISNTGKHRDSSRLIIVGDVHGMLNELTALLSKVQFDKNSDRLILAGDLISKGPDSSGVVDLAMNLGAMAVRGNHEDHILAAHAAINAKADLPNLPNPGNDIQKGKDNPEGLVSRRNAKKKLANILGNERIEWLKKCPLILRLGKLGDMGEVVVVHAGLEPGVKLQEQDPYMAMNMRTISTSGAPSGKHKGTGWIKDWNRYQKSLPKDERTTVIYGHDSRRGLKMKKYSMGIDTSCVNGGQLTAIVIKNEDTKHNYKLVQVDCPDGRSG